MNKFIVRLPGGNQAKKDVSKPKQTNNPKCQSTQAYLDLDDEDDVRSHTEFCKKANKAPSISTLTGHNIVSEFGDNGEVVLKVKLGQSLHSIIIDQIVKLAIEELGSTEDLVNENDDIFVMVDKKGTVAGCLVCEQVNRHRCATIGSSADAANIVIGTADQDDTNKLPAAAYSNPVSTLSKNQNTATYGKRKRSDLPAEGNNVVDSNRNIQASTVCDPPNESAQTNLMGVKLVWVHPTKRRQAVASRLLDTARRCFVYGSVVPVDNTAFSQPTESGFAFVSRYCRRDQILAYA